MPFTSEKGNPVTSGEGKGKSSYIRGEEREIMLHPEEEKEKAIYIRGEERENKLTSVRKKVNQSYIRAIKSLKYSYLRTVWARIWLGTLMRSHGMLQQRVRLRVAFVALRALERLLARVQSDVTVPVLIERRKIRKI